MKQAIKRTFDVGDIVRLKSGGPEMTLTRLPDALDMLNEDRVECQWFDGKKILHSLFPLASLKPVREDEDTTD